MTACCERGAAWQSQIVTGCPVQTSVEYSPTRTFATFTRAFDDDFTGEGEMDLLCAYHSDSTALAYHTSREGFTLTLDAPAAGVLAPAPAPAADSPAPAPVSDAPAGDEETTPDETSVDASSAPAPLTAAAVAVSAAVAAAAALL